MVEYKRHYLNSELYAISQEDLKGYFGDRQYRQVIKGDHLFNQFFTLELKAVKDQYCNGWRMNSNLSEEYSQYQHSYSKMENPLVTYRAPYRGSLWSCEVYNPKTDRPIPKRYQMKTTARIDMHYSIDHLDSLERSTIANFRYHADPIDGSLDIYYRKSLKCDRVFGFGHLNLQGLKKNP